MEKIGWIQARTIKGNLIKFQAFVPLKLNCIAVFVWGREGWILDSVWAQLGRQVAHIQGF